MDNCSNGICTSILDDIISDICNELNKNNNDVQNEIINPCPVNAEFIINETIAKSIGIILENSVVIHLIFIDSYIFCKFRIASLIFQS